ncbi:MAG: sigma-70 family RNA polymerase sigma factor [Proteobacteria bacterium]|nr:sigma-70 family RNA polymerase sigma factor [Pseudomonadota bacterium]
MMASGEVIAELLQRVARRDQSAFAPLYQATSAKLYGIILRILRHRELADEVLQEVYVRIWERAGDFRAEIASPIAWMAAIARNRALEDHPEAQDFEGDSETGLDRLLSQEESKKLMECLGRLDTVRRDMVVLAYCEGLSRDELAMKYSQPVNTIKTWLRRSLAQLKDCLGS